MEILNCRNCGRLFNYIGGQQICATCKSSLEEKFVEVKKYIYENKQASILQISEDMGVSTQQIRQWIREERLFFSDDSPLGIDCEICGTTIKTGRYCDACKSNMRNELAGAYKKDNVEKPKDLRDKDKMRYLKP